VHQTRESYISWRKKILKGERVKKVLSIIYSAVMHLAKMWQAELRKISDIVEMIESIAMDVELLLRHCNPILAFIEFIENEYKISWYLEDFMSTDGFVWNNNQSAAGSEVLVG